MKRNCNGCKALENYHGFCSLGYKIKGINHSEYMGLTLSYKPLEECPKPKTNMDYIKEWRK